MWKLFSILYIIFTEYKTAFYIYFITLGAFCGYNYFKIFLILIAVSIYPYLLSLSRWVITTINGKLNILAS
jgi:hypothetical protein